MACLGAIMIVIKNTQRRYALDTHAIKQDVEKILALVGYPEYELTIWCTNNTTIRRYNKQFRHKDMPTDVISFPYYIVQNPGILPKNVNFADNILGDIMLSVEYIAKKDYAGYPTLYERIRMILVHSICHLIGYDHDTDSDYAVMHQEEQRILKKLSQ
jgi:probable rRNA maturation factor